jgi:hypothetical protein
MVELLAGTNVLLLAFSVLIFDIPRYTLSLLSLALFGVRKPSAGMPAGSVSVSVIIPTFNGGSGLAPTICDSLWTGLQSVEYLMSISAGRSILDVAGAIACLSGACSMYRRDTFLRSLRRP